MPVVPIEDPADARVALYVGMTDADLRRGLEEAEGVFVVEGLNTLHQCVNSRYPVQSVLVAPARRDAALAELGPLAESVPVFVAAPAVLNAVTGFALHRGVVAIARRMPQPSVGSMLTGATTVAVLERVNDHENLGGIFRNAAAFGVGGVLLDPETSDPLYRRSVRVSQGHALRVPFARAASWPSALGDVKSAGYAVAALTPARDAVAIDEFARERPPRVAVLFGAEGPGLSAAALDSADVRVRIPMVEGVDSLNVAAASAVAFHRLSPIPHPPH